jgi:mRNA interferase HigB
MHIISFKKLKEFFTKDPNAQVSMEEWHKKAKKAEWDNFSDVKNTFNSVDNVGNDHYVFNVKGNHYRIIAVIRYRIKTIFLRWIGNHKDYDQLKDVDKL